MVKAPASPATTWYYESHMEDMTDGEPDFAKRRILTQDKDDPDYQ